MRRDDRNTAQSPVREHYRRRERPWAFRTRKGIFSTPVVGAGGTIFFGSADTYFYALNRKGRLRWRFKTGNIIDSAATIGRYDRRLRTTPVTFGSADERLYRLRSERRRRRRIIWAFRPTRKPATGQLVDWWEGNAATGPGGLIYAGNTGGGAYAVNPNGTQRWVFQAGNSVWTAPAMGADGSTYWGSLDLNVYKLDSAGNKVWSTSTIGFVTSSPALARDGTLYVGSWDGRLYALDSRTGLPKWSYRTNDHIYGSPALAEDARGRTVAIYIGSADGAVYAISPEGKRLWRYDTGDPVRSSPVLGRAPAGGGRILYVGSSNGVLYALDATRGRRRWSFDTTPRSTALRDRNDLNGSPALGRRGVYIGGEHGRLWYVPYDYCLHRRNPRCDSGPGETFGDDLTRVFYVSPGGSTLQAGPRAPVSPATFATGRLVVRRGSETLDAAMLGVPDGRRLVKTDPPFAFSAELSGDGHFVFVVPQDFLRPDTEYRVRVAGQWTADGIPVGNPVVGGTRVGSFGDSFRFRTRPPAGPLPLHVGRRRVTAFNMRRLAVPLPPLIPSANQIGFDSYEWIVSAVDVSAPDASGEGHVLLWVVGSRRNRKGIPIADPKSDFAFVLAGRYRGADLLLSQRNIGLTFSFGKVPLRRFEVRGRLGRGLRMLDPALYGEVACAEVPTYGPALFITGICNKKGDIDALGTFTTSRYSRRGPANRRPRGVRVSSLDLERPTATADGSATATFGLRRRYLARKHAVAILLTDAANGSPVSIDYKAETSVRAGARGNLDQVRLTIPKSTRLPGRIRAYVMTDSFPLAARDLSGAAASGPARDRWSGGGSPPWRAGRRASPGRAPPRAGA
jgi:outer membrane protein assembly factor BamB